MASECVTGARPALDQLRRDGWNPLYSAYARAQGRTEEEQCAADREKRPSAPAYGFLSWLNQRRTEFSQRHPEGWCSVTQEVRNYTLWHEFVCAYAVAASPSAERSAA